MLKSPLFWKMSTLLGCILLLSIPLMIVRQLIDERADYRSDVIEALESSTSGAQKLAGPLIAIPVTETLTRVEGKKRSNIKTIGCITGCRRRWRLTVIRTLNPGGSVSMKGKSGTIISASRRILTRHESRRSGKVRLRWGGHFWSLALAMRAGLARLRLLRSTARRCPLSRGPALARAERAFICQCRCCYLNKKRWILNSHLI